MYLFIIFDLSNDDQLLNHLQALLTKPDATGDFRLHK